MILARPGGSFRKRNRRGVVFSHTYCLPYGAACYNGPNGFRRSVVWKQQIGRRQGWIRASVRQCYDSILQEPDWLATRWRLYHPRNTLPLGVGLLIQGGPDVVKDFLFTIFGAEVPPCPKPRGRAYTIHLQVEV